MQAELIEAVWKQLGGALRLKKKKSKKRRRSLNKEQEARDLREMRESLMMPLDEFEDPMKRADPVYQPEETDVVSETWPPDSEHKLVHATHHYIKSKEAAMESRWENDRWFEITKEFLHHASPCTFEVAKIILIISRALDTKIVPTEVLMARSRTSLKPRNFGRVMGTPMGRRFFFLEDDFGFKVFGHHDYLELPEGHDVNDVVVGTRLSYFMIKPDLPHKSPDDDDAQTDFDHKGKSDTIYSDRAMIFPKAVQIRIVKWWTPNPHAQKERALRRETRLGKLKTNQLVEKNVFVPFKKTEMDLLREERQKIKEMEIAEKLEKKRAKKLKKKAKKGKKSKKRKTVKLESSPAEVEKISSPMIVCPEASMVAQTFSVTAAPAKSQGFHIPSF